MDDLKAKGNAAFSAGRYQEAVDHFTSAIEIAPDNHVLYSNRSAALSAMKKYSQAQEDAQKVVEIKPDWAKGYSRLGAALFGMQKLDDSIAAYKKGLELDSGNEQLKTGLAEVEAAKRSGGAGGMGGLEGIFAGPEVWAKLASDPKTKNFMSQPDFISMLSDVQQNPSNLSKYMNDPRMMQSMGVLMGINMTMATPDNIDKVVEEVASSDKKPEAAKPPPPKPKAPEPEPEPELSEAMKEKEMGNACYKRKEFDAAIEHYNKAIALEPDTIAFLTNRAAVYFETAQYDNCIKDCEDAIDKGREQRADYKMIARAMTRKGTALVKQGDLEKAIETFQKSLTEHRNPDTLKKMNEAEKSLKLKREQDYLDPAKAEEHREKGNTLFREQKYPEAVAEYTESLKRNPNDHRVYSNRAACYTKLTAFMEAQKDADKCIELKPDFVKGYSRKGAVQFFMKEYDKAMETYQKGLGFEADNEEMKDGIRRCVEAINKGNRGEMSEQEMKQRQERAMADPEIQGILQDPIMRQVLQDFQENPKAAAEHQRNPEVMAKIQKLINAGIVRTG